MKASEMKALTGAKSKTEAIGLLYARLEKRNFMRNGKTARLAGFDERKNLVHFTQTENAGAGSCWHTRIGLSLEDSLDAVSGNLDGLPFTILL